ncbi:flavin-containing monooxygenase [Paenibacillus paeoniae]|uniref:Oxidoreductase n=1 Tax=Paenibacillus paeoniae TaxID=2292705 RepID=A0A371PL23_9BACL|nr:NAD(P)-binding domain-containing protein [Paenibacillus paeoniae]REK76912.1 oxidoreductase [Paenibacillus paeoniae]
MTFSTDILVIGSGQAGLSTGYYLKRSNVDFLMIDQSSAIGESWRTRYDSLVLFTPKGYSNLPGMNFPGHEAQLPTKDEAADYLLEYAAVFELPIRLNTKATSITKYKDKFKVMTDKGIILTRSVIIATGPFQKPWVPDFSNKMASSINQIHSSRYKNPTQLIHGESLVVGAGNSGTQIAVELSNMAKVSISVGHKPLSLPSRILGKNIFYWLDRLGLLKAKPQSTIGRKIKSRPDPIFGMEFNQRVKSSAITLMPKVIDAEDEHILFADGTMQQYSNIIWCTGFRPDYSWLHIPGLLDHSGTIIHERGITPVSGLYVVGMPWQSRRSSALLGGVGEDAQYVAAATLRSLSSSKR